MMKIIEYNGHNIIISKTRNLPEYNAVIQRKSDLKIIKTFEKLSSLRQCKRWAYDWLGDDRNKIKVDLEK